MRQLYNHEHVSFQHLHEFGSIDSHGLLTMKLLHIKYYNICDSVSLR